MNLIRNWFLNNSLFKSESFSGIKLGQSIPAPPIVSPDESHCCQSTAFCSYIVAACRLKGQTLEVEIRTGREWEQGDK